MVADIGDLIGPKMNYGEGQSSFNMGWCIQSCRGAANIMQFRQAGDAGMTARQLLNDGAATIQSAFESSDGLISPTWPWA
jgi:hypothetical protein